MIARFIFIYGTLLPEYSHPMSDWLKLHSRPVCKGAVSGELYLVDDYPGLVYLPFSGQWTKGWIVELNDPEINLQKLDLYEGIGENPNDEDEYRREIIPVKGDDSLWRDCWVYIFNKDPKGLKKIDSGYYPDSI